MVATGVDLGPADRQILQRLYKCVVEENDLFLFHFKREEAVRFVVLRLQQGRFPGLFRHNCQRSSSEESDDFKTNIA